MGLRLFGAAASLLVLATRLTAQTLPMPTLPEQPSPVPIPETPGTPATAPAESAAEPALTRPLPWDYSLAVGVGWDSNISFQVPGGPSDVAIVPRGSLTRLFRGPRGRLRATAAGRWIGYADEKAQSRGYADFGLDGNYRSSPSTSWWANASYQFGHTDSSQPLLDQGVLLPLVPTRTLAGAIGVLRQTGAQTALRIDGRIYRVAFDTPGWLDSQSVRGTIGLEHRLGARSTGALVYSLENATDQVGESYLTHFGSLQWTRVLSPRTAVLLEGGADCTPDATRAGLDHEWSFFGGASLRREVGRARFTAFVRREVAPAFGTGSSRLEVRAGLSAGVPMGQNWALRVSADLVRPDDPADTQQSYASADNAFFSLGRRFGGRLEVSAEASYRRRGAAGTIPAVEAYTVGLFVTLGGSSRRATGPATSR